MVASPAHKLGQMIGYFLERAYNPKLLEIADEMGFYLDKQGPRPARHPFKKVTWVDKRGNSHDLDYVYEKNGSDNKLGKPYGFIELLWRRYTKHSKNKAGEIAAALLPLKATYDSCQFTGAIIAGEFTQGALDQLESEGINIFFVPFNKIADAFQTKDININYPEKMPSSEKNPLLETSIEKIENLSEEDENAIIQNLEETTRDEFNEFADNLKRCLSSKIDRIIVIPLFGRELHFNSSDEAITSIKDYEKILPDDAEFKEFEIFIFLSSGSRIHGCFATKHDAITFISNNDPQIML